MDTNRIMNREMVEKFRRELIEEEKSWETIRQYVRNVEHFWEFAGGNPVDKGMTVRYKEKLIHLYEVRSVNAKLSALNSFLGHMEWYDCVVKLLKIQKESFRASGRVLTKEDYRELLAAARRLGKGRLCLLMQTLCAMGLRVSELQFVTVEAVHRGYAEVRLKGKNRIVLMPEDLRVLLADYICQERITDGCVFITKSGNPMDRSNIWREMKKICGEAGVRKSKVFPHNLRHLFACVFYEGEKNANQLADIMGHSSLNTTRIYTQVSMEEELAALNRMHLVDISGYVPAGHSAGEHSAGGRAIC